MRLALSFAATIIFLYSPLGEAADFKLPPYQKISLDNGIQVFLMPQKEVPLVHLTVAFQGGSSLEPVELPGLAFMTGEALALGTKSFKKNQIEDRLDFLGAELRPETRADLSTIELSLAVKDAPQLLPLLAEIVMAPTFPDQEIIKLRERTISDLKKAKESPKQLADQYFNKLVFGQHPYGRPVGGHTLSVNRIKRQDLLNYHRQAFQPQRMSIGVAGDIDPKEMEALLRRVFGSWRATEQAGESVSLAMPDPKARTEARVLLVNKKDASETTFRIGGLGVPRNHQDWVSLQVINTILGGRFTSLLNEALRIKSGLTYGAWARFNGYKTAGSFVMGSFTANENTFKAIDLALQTYNKFLSEGFDQKTLDSAKAYVKGQFPPRYETLQSLSSVMVEIWAYRLPDQAIDNFATQVDALTLPQARALLKTYFPANNLDILMIGKASELVSGVQKYGRTIQSDMDRIDEAPNL